MLKEYKNHLLKLIEEANLDPAQFTASEDNSGTSSKFIVEYNNTGHKCHIVVNPRSYHHFWINYTTYNPGFPWIFIEDHQRQIYNNSIEGVKDYFTRWLVEVKKYIDESFAPDLWKQLENQNQLLKPLELDEIDTKLFDEDEKAQIRLIVGEFLQQLNETFKPTNEQQQLINKRLDYLIESTDRLNRFDWRAIALTTIFAIITTLSLDTDKGKQLFDLFKKLFSGIVHSLQ